MHSTTSGFSIIEAVMVLLLITTVVGALAPSVARQLGHARVNRAANVVAADFYLAQALAGRRRAPVQVTFSPGAKTTTIANGVGDTTFYTRRFGSEGEFKLSAFSATPATVLILPNGMANTSVTVTVGGASYSKQVRMTRAGQIRVIS